LWYLSLSQLKIEFGTFKWIKARKMITTTAKSHPNFTCTMTTPPSNNAAPASSDAMQNVMDEAQQLMDSLGMNLNEEETELSESIVIDGFSIDSDDEDEESAAAVDNQKEATTTVSMETNTSSGIPVPTFKTPSEDTQTEKESNGNNGGIQMPLHPLHEDVLVSPPTPPTPTNTGTPTSTTASTSLQPPPNHATSSFDFKAKTSLFASNLATFAQKAASQVADQITTTGSGTGGGTTVTPPINMTVEETSLVKVEMDNEQKAKLIHQYVGELLPGERVIMFLSNLLHVSDSSRREYPTQGMWCCCMTYYRMILFHTSDDSPQQLQEEVPPEWNPHCWKLPETPKLLQIPLASMDRVEKSVYTTPSNHTLMGLVIYGYVLYTLMVVCCRCVIVVVFHTSAFTLLLITHANASHDSRLLSHYDSTFLQKGQWEIHALYDSILCRYIESTRGAQYVRLSW